MNPGNHVWLSIIVATLIGHCCYAQVANAQAGPTSVWQFMGIPQGMQKIKDATVNRRGNNPKRERKPALKPLADPANLESPNPAIKEAAAIKVQEDLKKQKIKAIKYLAEVGCGCYPGVKEALMAALDDCTEDVRYEAAVAFCTAAGNPCRHCNNSGCCSAEVMTKLHEVAHGRDARGCWKETSSKVRQAAAAALDACRRVRGSDTAAVPEEPTPAAPGKEVEEGPAPGEKEVEGTQPPQFPEAQLLEGGQDTVADMPPSDITGGETDFSPSPYDMASSLGAASGPMGVPSMIGDQFGSGSDASVVVQNFSFGGLGRESGPGLFYTLDNGNRVALSFDNEGSFDPSIGLWNYPIRDYNDENSRLGGAPLNSVPGDGALVDGTTTTPDFDSYASNFRVRYLVSLPTPSANVGRTKIAENASPIPRDRLVFNYSYFDNVPLIPTGTNVHRFTLGFEKTFSNQTASIEVKAPMLSTLNSTRINGAAPDGSHYEFGNLSVTFKKLLLMRKTWALAMGVQTVAPTADDIQLLTGDGTPLVRIENQAVFVEPFVGGVWAPSERFFMQGFAQWAVDVNGNRTLVNQLVNQNNQLVYAGRMHDATYQYIDVAMGYWLRRCHRRFKRLTGVAAVAELHWNRSLQATDVITSGDFVIGSDKKDVEVFNLTLGCFFEFRKNTTVLVGYSTPLGGGSDQQFDGELRILLNRRFGPQNRITRTPF